MTTPLFTVELAAERDLVLVRQRTRQLAALFEFSIGSQTRLVTAVSEISRNAIQYGGGGVARFLLADDEIIIRTADRGPGISKLEEIWKGTYRSATGLGKGIVGAKKLVDRLSLETGPDGTAVEIAMKVPADGPRPTPSEIAGVFAAHPVSPLDEMQRQNRELLVVLGEARVAEDRLTRANDARQSMLAVVSHDLRNHINAVTLGIELLPPSNITAAVSRSAQRMERLVGDLLDTASITAGRFSIEMDVHRAESLAREAASDFVAPTDVAIEVSLDAPGVVIECDRGRIMQVFSNLIGNAAKFSRPGDKITVGIRAEASAVVFSVADTGPGIPDDERPRIFDDFWSAPRNASRGTGLGLFIAKGIVAAHSGEIWAGETDGGGATLSFRLPSSRGGLEAE